MTRDVLRLFPDNVDPDFPNLKANFSARYEKAKERAINTAIKAQAT
jgi:hypothetical protein